MSLEVLFELQFCQKEPKKIFIFSFKLQKIQYERVNQSLMHID